MKSSLGSELKLKMSISGKKFKPDYNGDPLKGTVEQKLWSLTSQSRNFFLLEKVRVHSVQVSHN